MAVISEKARFQRRPQNSAGIFNLVAGAWRHAGVDVHAPATRLKIPKWRTKLSPGRARAVARKREPVVTQASRASATRATPSTRRKAPRLSSASAPGRGGPPAEAKGVGRIPGHRAAKPSHRAEDSGGRPGSIPSTVTTAFIA